MSQADETFAVLVGAAVAEQSGSWSRPLGFRSQQQNRTPASSADSHCPPCYIVNKGWTQLLKSAPLPNLEGAWRWRPLDLLQTPRLKSTALNQILNLRRSRMLL